MLDSDNGTDIESAPACSATDHSLSSQGPDSDPSVGPNTIKAQAMEYETGEMDVDASDAESGQSQSDTQSDTTPDHDVGESKDQDMGSDDEDCSDDDDYPHDLAEMQQELDDLVGPDNEELLYAIRAYSSFCCRIQQTK